MIKTTETKMPSFYVKIHTKHQSRHTGHHTLIMHSLTLPVSMQACMQLNHLQTRHITWWSCFYPYFRSELSHADNHRSYDWKSV